MASVIKAETQSGLPALSHFSGYMLRDRAEEPGLCVTVAADKAPVKVLRSSPYRRQEEQGFLLLLLLQIPRKKIKIFLTF